MATSIVGSAPGRAITGRATARRVGPPLLTAGGIGLATLALHARDPHQQGSWGLCPLKFLTGWDCPGCGGLRAVNDLTNFDLAGAASSNLLFVLAIPLLILAWAWWLRRSWQGDQHGDPSPRSRGLRNTSLVWGQLALGLIAVFTVVRNLPMGAWLAS